MSFGINLMGPPRHLPLLVRMRILFGGALNQIGWLMFGFGMVFYWAFCMNSDLTGWYTFRGAPTTSGVVTRCEKTHFSEGGGEDTPGTPIYAHRYEFALGGQKYQGVSYSVGRESLLGMQVTIEYRAGNPARSRIEGCRSAPFGPGVMFVLLFPAIGGCLIMVGSRGARRTLRLLVHGKQAVGTLKSKEPTNVEVNKKTVYKLTFEFQDEQGATYDVVAKTHNTARLEDDPREPLLYDPAYPQSASLLDHLPGSPKIDAMGSIQIDSVGRALLVMILPALSIFGHGTYALLRLAG